jgi:sulfur relay (sulfurtransferase) DsrC/TusE family protein
MKPIELGIKIESEHIPTYNYLKKYIEKKGHLPSKRDFFKKIAENHISEDKNYYKKLGRCKL